MSTSNYPSSTGTTPGATTGSDEIQILEIDEHRPISGTRIRGSAVLSGGATAIATFVLLEMLLLATDLSGTQVSVANPDTGSWIWDGAAAIVAFFIGGAVTTAALPYKGADTGALNGIVMWAATIVGLIALTGIVGGGIFGALGDVLANNQTAIADAAEATTVTESMASDARDAAGWAALGLVATLAAACIGGVAGVKTWPNRDDNNNARRRS